MNFTFIFVFITVTQNQQAVTDTQLIIHGPSTRTKWKSNYLFVCLFVQWKSYSSKPQRCQGDRLSTREVAQVTKTQTNWLQSTWCNLQAPVKREVVNEHICGANTIGTQINEKTFAGGKKKKRCSGHRQYCGKALTWRSRLLSIFKVYLHVGCIWKACVFPWAWKSNRNISFQKGLWLGSYANISEL